MSIGGDKKRVEANAGEIDRPVPPPGDVVGPVPSPGAHAAQVSPSAQPGIEPRRLRRLHRVWPDRDGNISYLLTLCVDGRLRVLDNEPTFERLVAFLLDSPRRYQWFGRRFVIMPDHLHVIARMGASDVPLGKWVKAMKAVVGGLQENRTVGPVPSPGAVVGPAPPFGNHVGPVPSPGAPVAPRSRESRQVLHPFTRSPRSWRWQKGFHDHKFRTPESESRKWEYICLNPVRYRLVSRPEDWPFGGEIFHDVGRVPLPGVHASLPGVHASLPGVHASLPGVHASLPGAHAALPGESVAAGPQLVRGTPPLLDTGVLISEDGTPVPKQL